ncbi:transcriptional regulator NrdR [Candidatus Gracilibacteria bacterium]|nr:transcriptional regulator NrdR [Candidatus Gracilibacteria bacterium]
MKCPKCQSMETKVIDSRMIEDGQVIRRRRECEFCSHRFTTFEKKGVTELIIIKNDGTKQMYDRQKIKRGLILSFAKRKIENEIIENIINNLEIKRQNESNEINSNQIGEDILEELKKLDPVAFVRFASVYKSFNDLEDFKKFIG